MQKKEYNRLERANGAYEPIKIILFARNSILYCLTRIYIFPLDTTLLCLTRIKFLPLILNDS